MTVVELTDVETRAAHSAFFYHLACIFCKPIQYICHLLKAWNYTYEIDKYTLLLVGKGPAGSACHELRAHSLFAEQATFNARVIATHAAHAPWHLLSEKHALGSRQAYM